MIILLLIQFISFSASTSVISYTSPSEWVQSYNGQFPGLAVCSGCNTDIAVVDDSGSNSNNGLTSLEDHKGILMPSFFQMFKYQILNRPIGPLKLKNENKIKAQSEKGSLQLIELNIPWIKIFEKESFHAGDYNFFWLNIRENLFFRLSNYFDE